MIFAELRGKLGGRYQRAQETSEDLLTSTAFGLLRYLPFNRGLGALLARARVVVQNSDRVTCDSVPGWIDLNAGTTSTPIEFWPRLQRGGEPDLRLTLNDGAEVILIEVKLHAGKSQTRHLDSDTELDESLANEESLDEQRIDSDQLVRYFVGQREELPPTARVSLIYLTSHALPPLEDLLESLEHAKRQGVELRLAWLSWRDVWAVADDEGMRSSADSPARDLAMLLRQKGLYIFRGFARSVRAEIPAAGRFWIGTRPPFVRDHYFFAWASDTKEHRWTRRSGRFFATRRGA